MDLVEAGTITAEEAYRHSFEKASLVAALRIRGIDVSFVEVEPATSAYLRIRASITDRVVELAPIPFGRPVLRPCRIVRADKRDVGSSILVPEECALRVPSCALFSARLRLERRGVTAIHP